MSGEDEKDLETLIACNHVVLNITRLGYFISLFRAHGRRFFLFSNEGNCGKDFFFSNPFINIYGVSKNRR